MAIIIYKNNSNKYVSQIFAFPFETLYSGLWWTSPGKH